ncbi:DUF6468 domain-containing protein [Elstera litoralis]|uniref:DUF6468 domain-containing protein n=1 Tax=Elstera litoralis TaxID=552518 RepID=UPI00069698E9|nr:DUF6468 domain-containing protein [Elstera litoralis]
MMTFGFYLNVIVALLLVATVIFCWVLNKKLNVIRNHRAELEALIAAFNDSCVRAESGVKALRSATDEATRLQQYLERSQNLRDDLSYLVDRGGSLADRLEGGVRTARTEVGRPGAKPEARDNVSRLPERALETSDRNTDGSGDGYGCDGRAACRASRAAPDRNRSSSACRGSRGSGLRPSRTCPPNPRPRGLASSSRRDWGSG